MLRSRPNITAAASAAASGNNASSTNQQGGVSHGTVKRRKTRSKTKAGYQSGSSLERVMGMVALCLMFGVALTYISSSNSNSNSSSNTSNIGESEISPYEYQKKRLYHRNQQQQQKNHQKNHRHVRGHSSSANIPNPQSMSQHTNKKNHHHKQQQHQQHQQHNHNLTSIYNLQYSSIDGEVISFSKFIGSVALIINVASEWGKTDLTYHHIQQFIQRYSQVNNDQKQEQKQPQLYILAFPTNDFHQEPGSNEEIKQKVVALVGGQEIYEKSNFVLFQQSELGQNSIYQMLHSYMPNKVVKHNFFKYVIGKDGIPVSFHTKKETLLDVEEEVKGLIDSTLQ